MDNVHFYIVTENFMSEHTFYSIRAGLNQNKDGFSLDD